MQNIAIEMNLSETSFIYLRKDQNPMLRWFTLMYEIDFCGHATMATTTELIELVIICLSTCQQTKAMLSKSLKSKNYCLNYQKHLNIVIPALIKLGNPYPFSIYKWLEGRSANHVTLDESTLENLAFQLANFLKELQATTDVEGPSHGQEN